MIVEPRFDEEVSVGGVRLTSYGLETRPSEDGHLKKYKILPV